MAELLTSIEQVTNILRRVQASSLESVFLRETVEALQASDILPALKAYRKSLPPSPDDAEEKEAHRKAMAVHADQVNRAAEPFLQELERIKRMRQTLNLEALDPLIREGRTIIHAIHGFTADIQG